MLADEVRRAANEVDPVAVASEAVHRKLVVMWVFCVSRISTMRIGSETSCVLPSTAKALIVAFLGFVTFSRPPPSALSALARRQLKDLALEMQKQVLIDAFMDKFIFPQMVRAARTCLFNVDVVVSREMSDAFCEIEKQLYTYGICFMENDADGMVNQALERLGYRCRMICVSGCGDWMWGACRPCRAAKLCISWE